jgi:hypothetical protein
MKPGRRRRRVAGLVAVGLLLGACTGSGATIRAGELSENDTATYLILSDQLQRVRNVRAREASASPEARVCVGILPQGAYGGIAPVPNDIVDRLRDDQAKVDIKLDIVSSFECLAHYTREDAGFTAEESDALSYAGPEPSGQCGKWIGGTSGRETIQYDIAVESGMARLSGASRCARQYWVRT